MLHEKLVEDVMDMLLEGNLELLQVIKKQYNASTIKSIEDTGAGFYVNFEVRDISLKLQSPKDNISFGDVYGMYDGIFGAVGFVLFIRNGFISCLEGYSNIGGLWPTDDTDIELYYSTQGQRDFSNLFN